MERMPQGVYAQEFREQAVKLVEAEGLSMSEAARRLSMPVGRLKKRLHAARAGKLKEVGKTQKPLSDPELKLARTKTELAEVKQERDLLKSLRSISRRSRGEIRPDRNAATGISRGGPLPAAGRFRERPPSARAREEARLGVEIRARHQHTRETCGPARLPAQLSDHGVQAGVHRSERIRKKVGLRCRQKKKYQATGHAGPVPGRCHQTAGQGADSPFRPRQPVLPSRLPETSRSVRHVPFDESQGLMPG